MPANCVEAKMADQASTFTEADRRAILTALYALLEDTYACESLNEGGMEDFSRSDVIRAIEKLEALVVQ
jgi:hypothetical protein